uniref:Uncharacterized protein n=1 Tax=Caenorhabditis japonica TaxID=281687 RepID=A0A8R1DY22_CAEJA
MNLYGVGFYTYTDSSSRTLNCGVKLIVTDQGYGVSLSERTKRSTENTANKEWSVDGKVNYVTSNQLAAQLLALENAVLDSSASWFARNFLDWCHNLNSLTASTMAAAASNPTLAARQMLRKENVHARFVSKGYLAVQTCSALAPDSYRFVAFKNLCYSKPAIEVVLPEGNTITTFLDLATNEITNRAHPVECSLTTNFQFIVNDTPASLNPFTLELKETKNFHAENDLHSSNSLISQALQELLIFHNMVIGSISEEINENHYNEIWAALQGSPEAITKTISRNSDPASGSIAGGKLEQILSFWYRAKWLGGVIFTVWTLIVDTLVTGVILALIFMYFATGFLSAYLSFSRSMPKHELERVVTPRPTLDEYEEIRNRLATPRINALETSSQEFFIAQIPIKANGIHCWALIDTGDSFTVASEDMCCLLGIGQLLEPTSHTAVDGSFMLFQDTHSAKGKCVPSGPQSYEFILGNDLLQRLPKFYLDYTKGVFEIVAAKKDDTEYDPEFKKAKTYDNLAPKTSDIEIFTQYTESELLGFPTQLGEGQPKTFIPQATPEPTETIQNGPIQLLNMEEPRNANSPSPTTETRDIHPDLPGLVITTLRAYHCPDCILAEELPVSPHNGQSICTIRNGKQADIKGNYGSSQSTSNRDSNKGTPSGLAPIVPRKRLLEWCATPRDSSAWKLAKAVADGGRLHRRPPCDTSLPQVCDFLNDPQREYCQMHLLDLNAATLANSPPGVGKTVMISAAAIAASSILPGKLNIICGVTNASASKAVVKLAELEANNPVQFTRLISEQNRQRQRDILVGTVFSVVDSFANQWAPFANQIATVQVDEASQLPLFALIALLATFPNGKFGPSAIPAILGSGGLPSAPPDRHRDLRGTLGTTSIALLCYYRSQAGLLSSLLDTDPFIATTIDGAQRQEFDVVIVLTTRTRSFRNSPFFEA